MFMCHPKRGFYIGAERFSCLRPPETRRALPRSYPLVAKLLGKSIQLINRYGIDGSQCHDLARGLRVVGNDGWDEYVSYLLYKHPYHSLFTEWTTTTVAAYIGTIICLFILTILNRFLGALKFQIERAWLDKPQTGTMFPVSPRGSNARSFFKAKTSPMPPYLIREDDSECDPLAPSGPREPADKWSLLKE